MKSIEIGEDREETAVVEVGDGGRWTIDVVRLSVLEGVEKGDG
jgi:hypothetical protein